MYKGRHGLGEGGIVGKLPTIDKGAPAAVKSKRCKGQGEGVGDQECTNARGRVPSLDSNRECRRRRTSSHRDPDIARREEKKKSQKNRRLGRKGRSFIKRAHQEQQNGRFWC